MISSSFRRIKVEATGSFTAGGCCVSKFYGSEIASLSNFYSYLFIFWVAETETAPNWNSEILLSATPLCVILFLLLLLLARTPSSVSNPSRAAIKLSWALKPQTFCDVKWSKTSTRSRLLTPFSFFSFKIFLFFLHYWNKLLVARRQICLSFAGPRAARRWQRK